MKPWLIVLLALVLAACSEPDAPTAAREPVSDEAVDEPAVRQAADVHPDELRARWLELEHARHRAAAPEPVPVPELSVQADEPAATKPSAEPAPASDDPAERPAIAILIDDVGHSLTRGRRLLALPVPVALAILPHTQAARTLAEEAALRGRTAILHQPMENGAGMSIGPGGLYSGMPAAELQQVLRSNLDSLEHISGLNNHMGSRLTAERAAMDQVMQVLRERGLFFIDSRTTHLTQAAFAAEAAGVPHLSRNVFLDNERNAEAIGRAFDRALEVARREGKALVIGHPYPQTLDFLERRLGGDLMAEEGVQVVDVVELLRRE